MPRSIDAQHSPVHWSYGGVDGAEQVVVDGFKAKDGTDNSYDSNGIDIAPGESRDVLFTAPGTPGTYLLYDRDYQFNLMVQLAAKTRLFEYIRRDDNPHPTAARSRSFVGMGTAGSTSSRPWVALSANSPATKLTVNSPGTRMADRF